MVLQGGGGSAEGLGCAQVPAWLCWGSSGLQNSFPSWFHTAQDSWSTSLCEHNPSELSQILLVFTKPGLLFLVNYLGLGYATKKKKKTTGRGSVNVVIYLDLK